MKMISPTLYCVTDPSLIIGNLTYRINWLTNQNVEAPNIINCKDLIDEFNDEICEVTIEAPERIKVNLLYFIKSKKEHGFSYLDQFKDGLADFFSNSWVWSSSQNQFLCFDLVEKELESKSLFPGKVYEGIYNPNFHPIEMVIHRPSSQFLTEFSKGQETDVSRFNCLYSLLNGYRGLKRDILVKAIFDMTLHCDFISLWLHGPDRPLLLTNDIDTIMRSISSFCKNNSILFKPLKHEEDLPRW